MKRALLLALALALCGCDKFTGGGAATSGTSPAQQRLIDESDIARVAASIDDAVDRKDWVAARGFFADEIDADFSTLGGTPDHISADQLIANWKTSLPAAKPSFHLAGAALITIDGDKATLTEHGYAWNRLLNRPANDNLWEVWGVYEEKFARVNGAWKVTSFKFTKTYERGDPSIRTATPDAQPAPVSSAQ